MKCCNNCLNKDRNFTLCNVCSVSEKNAHNVNTKDFWVKKPYRKGDEFIWESK